MTILPWVVRLTDADTDIAILKNETDTDSIFRKTEKSDYQEIKTDIAIFF